MSKLSKEQHDCLRLCQRSKADPYGWIKCSPKMYNYIIKTLPEDLLDRHESVISKSVRLTDRALIVLEYL